MMSLKDKYKQLAGGAPAAQPSVAPATTTAPAASAASTPAASAPAPVQTTVAPPGVGGSRDLAAMRAKLAQRQTGGVNPPEAVAAVTPALLEPRTQETPDGGAEPLVDAAATTAAPAASSGTTATATGATAPGSEPGAPALTRGQKAAATRAANKAKAGGTGSQSASSTPAETPSAGAGAAGDAGGSVSRSLAEFPLEDLLREIVRRVS